MLRNFLTIPPESLPGIPLGIHPWLLTEVSSKIFPGFLSGGSFRDFFPEFQSFLQILHLGFHPGISGVLLRFFNGFHLRFVLRNVHGFVPGHFPRILQFFLRQLPRILKDASRNLTRVSDTFSSTHFFKNLFWIFYRDSDRREGKVEMIRYKKK